MAVKNSGNALWHLRTLFNVGAIGALTDGQLLERFTTGRGEARELAFAALVERHGPLVLRICRAVLQDDHAAHDAFQATFLALARKAGLLWARDSLAPWLHQVAYRAACHDRAARFRRRAHERASAALRPELTIPRDRDDMLEQVIHEEIDRLPHCYRVTVVLCDLEGRTHEQAARHLGCAVGTVKSRLARGRQKLRGRLIRRGVAPTTAVAAGHAASTARSAVPAALAESTVVYAATAGAVPLSIRAITEGVLLSMYLSKLKLVVTATAVVTALTAGAVALAQQGNNRTNDPPGQKERAASPAWTYQIFASRDGEPPRKVAVVEMVDDTPIRVDAPGALILFQPKQSRRLYRTPGSEQVPKQTRSTLELDWLTRSAPDPIERQIGLGPVDPFANNSNSNQRPDPYTPGWQSTQHSQAQKAGSAADPNAPQPATNSQQSGAHSSNDQAAQPASNSQAGADSSNDNAAQPASNNKSQNSESDRKSGERPTQNRSKNSASDDEAAQRPSQNKKGAYDSDAKAAQPGGKDQSTAPASQPRDAQTAHRYQNEANAQNQAAPRSAPQNQHAADRSNPQAMQPAMHNGAKTQMMDTMRGAMDKNPTQQKTNTPRSMPANHQTQDPASPSSDTNRRLDQLERKVDLILEALKATRRPAGNSPFEDPGSQ
jgi:RNA polymerase sigma factor (sigma-70 family)